MRANMSPICDKKPMVGLTFSMTANFGSSKIGMTLKDVSFANFDCAHNIIAVDVGDKQARNGNDICDAVTKLNGIEFNNIPVRLSACRVEGQKGKIDYIAIEDVNGDLNPNGKSPRTRGFLVSRYSPSNPIIGANCKEDKVTCLSYCENICLQTIVIYVFYLPSFIEMVVTDASGIEFIIPSW